MYYLSMCVRLFELRVSFLSIGLLIVYFHFRMEMPEGPQPGTKATLTRDERHVLIHTMVVHLLAQSDAELRRLFDVNQRELTELTNTLVTKVWNALQAQWEVLKAEPQLVGGGLLRKEVLKAMGEIEYGIKHLDKAGRENLDNRGKIKMVQELYNAHRNVHKGKRPAATEVEPQRLSLQQAHQQRGQERKKKEAIS